MIRGAGMRGRKILPVKPYCPKKVGFKLQDESGSERILMETSKRGNPSLGLNLISSPTTVCS